MAPSRPRPDAPPPAPADADSPFGDKPFGAGVGDVVAQRYRLVARLGTGGMGQVFLAHVEGPAGFQKELALKVAHDHVADDRGWVDAFLAEARLSANLTHANIAQIYDLGRSGGGYFIAMEYVRGMDLRALMAAARGLGKQLPFELCAYIVAKLCEGLDFAHRYKDASGRALKLVHRDVSPANCLISHSGEVKLIDFGIAKATTERNRTATGMVKGKIGYMSPEQVRAQPLDRRSDVFTVGVVLYELLCGRRPFDVESELETMRNTLQGDFTPPRKVNPHVPEALEKIVLRAMAHDKAARYAWCSELQEDLQRWLYTTGQPVTARHLAEYLARVSGAPQEAEDAPVTAPTRELQPRDKATGELGLSPSPRAGKSAWLAAALVGVLTSAVVVGGAWVWRARQQQAPKPVTFVPVAELPVEEPPKAPEPPPPAPEPAPAEAPKPAAPIPAPAVAKPAPRPKPEPATAAAGTAYLNITANRPAEVFLDNKKIGAAPQTHFPVRPGRHEVRVDCIYESGRHTGAKRVVELGADDEADIAHECIESKEVH